MSYKKITFVIIILLLTIPVFVLAQRPLEVTYPVTPGGTSPTAGMPIARYIQYIYNISFGIAATIALAAIIYAGFLYLSSAGNPTKISEAKSRIISALLGIGILSISYVLLVFINPETVMFITPQLQQINTPASIPSIAQLRTEQLGTVKEIGVMGGLIIQDIEGLGNDIYQSSLLCNCIFAEALCLCDGGDASSTCQPDMCFAGEDADGHPCPDYDQMIGWQELIMFRLDELVYYQNRAVGTNLLRGTTLQGAAQNVIQNIISNAMSGNVNIGNVVSTLVAGALNGEARSLQEDINNVIDPAITYYQNYKSALPASQTDPREIQVIDDKITNENNKKQLKQDLIIELVQFGFFVEAIKEPITDLATLTEQCALETQNQCEAQCLPNILPTEAGACHDTIAGCQAICTGTGGNPVANPCPIITMTPSWLAFQVLEGLIDNSTQEIIRLVDEIRLLY